VQAANQPDEAMTDNSSDKPPPRLVPFDVFRSDGATQVPGQRFPTGETPAQRTSTGDIVKPDARSGPIDQRSIHDARIAPKRSDTERHNTVLRNEDTSQPQQPDPEPVTIRVQTYRLDLAERIARVKADQREALDNLQQLQDDSQDKTPAGGKAPNDKPDA
jgi:hypothetical protein